MYGRESADDVSLQLQQGLICMHACSINSELREAVSIGQLFEKFCTFW